MKKLLPFILAVTLLSGCAGAPAFKSEADERLYRSIENGGDLSDVRRSVEDGASIDELRRGRFVSENMVQFAVYCGRPDIAEWLISNGANISYKTTVMGETLLMYTAAAAEPELCRLLIEKGADISASDRLGDTALEYAFKAPGDIPESVVDDVVTRLVASGAELRRETLSAALGGYSGTGDGDCRYGLVRRVAAALRDAGIETRLRPVVEAAIFGGDLSSALVGAGAEDKRLALFYAAAFGTADTVRSLADAGVNTKAADRDGNTPLIIAAQYGNTETARYLIEQKPDFAAKNNRGQTAVDAARSAGNSELASMLEDASSVAAAALNIGGGCECCCTCARLGDSTA